MIESIFKAYDIRGVYPAELDADMARLIGRAIGRQAGVKKVVTGYDARLSSPELHEALVEGLLSEGVDVDELGLVPTELVYFSVGKFGYDAGLVVTASHNPKEYNGIRMVNSRVEMQTGRMILEYVKRLKPGASNNIGRRQTVNYISAYVDHVLTFINPMSLKPLRVVIDAGNGAMGAVLTELLKKLPIEAIPLHFEPDGNFPHRPPNPLLPEAQTEIIERVRSAKANLGVIFDGDGDRVLFVTEQGEFIRGDIGLLLLAQVMLKKYPGKGVSYNVVCSRSVPEKIAAWGGRPIRTRVGFVNVSGGLRQHDGVVGGEAAGHYCFRDNYFADSGLIAFVTVLQMLSDANQSMSQLVKDLNPYARTEIYYKIDKAAPIIEALKQQYSDGRQDELDGLTVQYPDWWFNVRPSNTEPLLRLTVEADKPEKLLAKMKSLTEFLTGEGAVPEKSSV